MNFVHIYETSTIYALYDPRNGELRYLGVTALSLSQRLKTHIRDRIRSKCPRALWLCELADLSLVPIITALEVVPFSQWQMRERQWIRHLRDLGYRLTNDSDGGVGRSAGGVLSPELRARVSAGLRRYFESCPAARQAIGLVHRGKPISESHKKIVSIATKKRWALWRANGCVTSLETRAKISASRSHKPVTLAHRAALSRALKGKPKNPLHKQHLGDHLRRLASLRENDPVLRAKNRENLQRGRDRLAQIRKSA